MNAVEGILAGLIVDLNYEVKSAGDAFDYKADLKSPNKIADLATRLLRDYEKEIAKGKTKPLADLLNG